MVNFIVLLCMIYFTLLKCCLKSMHFVLFSGPWVLDTCLLVKSFNIFSSWKWSGFWKYALFAKHLLCDLPDCKDNFTFCLRPESKQEPVKTEMGPPPSPASTCSDASSIASSASMPYSKSYVQYPVPSAWSSSPDSCVQFVSYWRQFLPLNTKHTHTHTEPIY